MSKRPHDDVDKTEEDLNQQVYTGGICRRRLAVAIDMEGMELRSSVVLPMPVNFRPPYAGRLRPGEEALEIAALATVVYTFQFPSSPAAGAASSTNAAMQDDTASGRDTAPVADQGTASGQGAAPHPERETASDRDGNPFASGQGAPANPDRGTASSQVAPAQDADMQDAPPQEADRQTAAPQTEEMIDRKGFHWRKDNMWQIWMWWDSDERNWMWQDDNGWWNPNWQPPWRWRNDGERNWSAQTWRESSSWGSMEE